MSLYSTHPSQLEAADAAPRSFDAAVREALIARGMELEAVCPFDDGFARRILAEYGALFIAASAVRVPPRCVFDSAEEVDEFQRQLEMGRAEIEGVGVELQAAALAALLRAREIAQMENLNITPRGGAEATRRTFADGLRLWESRFFPALDYWREQGRLDDKRIAALLSLAPHKQAVTVVLELEAEGIFFSKDFTKSVLYSVAPPGTSQHLALLAFDATEFRDRTVREILRQHGWFQTVVSDLPHFTFLGLEERDLPAHGLRFVTINEQEFWIPDV